MRPEIYRQRGRWYFPSWILAWESDTLEKTLTFATCCVSLVGCLFTCTSILSSVKWVWYSRCLLHRVLVKMHDFHPHKTLRTTPSTQWMICKCRLLRQFQESKMGQYLDQRIQPSQRCLAAKAPEKGRSRTLHLESKTFHKWPQITCESLWARAYEHFSQERTLNFFLKTLNLFLKGSGMLPSPSELKPTTDRMTS